MTTSERWTADDIPDQQGRTAVITGANSGIGYEVARALARRGATVVLGCRDRDRAEAARSRLRATYPGALVETVALDLASLGSVRDAAAELRRSGRPIHLLVNNAGVMWVPRRLTVDGFELHLGTNHLGHFALTGLLLDRMLALPDARVVTVASISHRIGRVDFDDAASTHHYGRLTGYGRSKLANLLFTYELQRRLAAASAGAGAGPVAAGTGAGPIAGPIAVAAHPGAAATELGRHAPRALRGLVRSGSRLVLQNAWMGALPVLRAATDPAVRGGEYYGPGGFLELYGYPVRVESSAQSHAPELQRWLWEISSGLTGVTYPL